MKTKEFVIIMVIFFAMVFSLTAQVINAGVGGNSTVNLLERLNHDVLEKRPDLVILMVGTNDMLNTKKMISYSSYQNNLDSIVKKIKENSINLLLMSPPPVDSVYLFDRHDKNLFKEFPNLKLDNARQIIAGLAKNESLSYLDLFQVFSEMNLPKHNEDLFFKNVKNCGKRDGVHPTALGYRFIGELIFRYLKEANLLEENQKIICFGDSITFGSGVQRNETYPAILQAYINRDQ